MAIPLKAKNACWVVGEHFRRNWRWNKNKGYPETQSVVRICKPLDIKFSYLTIVLESIGDLRQLLPRSLQYTESKSCLINQTFEFWLFDKMSDFVFLRSFFPRRVAVVVGIFISLPDFAKYRLKSDFFPHFSATFAKDRYEKLTKNLIPKQCKAWKYWVLSFANATLLSLRS